MSCSDCAKKRQELELELRELAAAHAAATARADELRMQLDRCEATLVLERHAALVDRSGLDAHAGGAAAAASRSRVRAGARTTVGK